MVSYEVIRHDYTVLAVPIFSTRFRLALCIPMSVASYNNSLAFVSFVYVGIMNFIKQLNKKNAKALDLMQAV